MELGNKFLNSYVQIWEQATVSDAFREKIKKDPVSAFNEFLPEPIPESFTIKVLEQDPAYSVTFLLPPEKKELPEDDVNSVSGGFGITAVASMLGVVPMLGQSLFKGIKKIF